MKTMKIPDKKTVEARLSKPRKSEFFIKCDGEKTTTRTNGDLCYY
jgi:NAD kinase